MADLTEPELRRDIVQLRRRVEKLAALLPLVLAVLWASGFTFSRERLPDGDVKMRILHAVNHARACIPLRALLRSSRCRRVGSMPGGGTLVRWMISRPVRTRRRIDWRPPKFV